MRSIIVWAALAVALPAMAAEPSTPPADVPAAPKIEVVREGGVADAWRDEGGDFATFGPEGDAVVPTVETQALQALANAYDVQFVDLLPPDESAPGVLDICTSRSDCIGGRRVIARVAGDTIAKYALARDVAGEWLAEGTPGPAGTAAAWSHGLTFSSDGHAWEVLADYEAGRYLLRRDGADVGTGRLGGVSRRGDLDALLDSAAR